MLTYVRRRRAVRRAYRADCQAVRLAGFRLVGDRILDLSPRGALIAIDRVVVPGEELLLSFRAPRRLSMLSGTPWRPATPRGCPGARQRLLLPTSRAKVWPCRQRSHGQCEGRFESRPCWQASAWP